MATSSHLEQITRCAQLEKGGAEVWRKWRDERLDETIDLNNADLSGLNLSSFDLGCVNLKNAKMARTKLHRADLYLTDLSGATLCYCSATRAKLAGAQLGSADLTDANLADSDLVGATLTNSKLIRCKLTRANLSHAILDGSDLYNADLASADLRFTQGLRFDSTIIDHARFAPNANDSWSILRRSYTGTRMLFHLLLLMAFILPYIARTIAWVSVNRVQESIITLKGHLHALGGQLQTEKGRVREIGRTLVGITDSIQPCLRETCTQFTVGQVIIGADRGATFSILAFALIFYNICRAVLTALVGPLREDEERSGYSPPLRYRTLHETVSLHFLSLKSSLGRRDDSFASRWKSLRAKAHELWSRTHAYGWLIWPHRLMKVLIWVAVVSLVWHVLTWLTMPVWLPAT
jgi:hypothetical protein